MTPFQFPIRVYWEDTDAGGIVFYANYLKFFERARTEWLRSLGLEQSTLREQTGGMFIVSQTNISYLQAARLDDVLQVSAELSELGKVSLIITQTVRIGEQVLCNGTIRIAWVHATSLKPLRIPTELSVLLTKRNT